MKELVILVLIAAIAQAYYEIGGKRYYWSSTGLIPCDHERLADWKFNEECIFPDRPYGPIIARQDLCTRFPEQCEDEPPKHPRPPGRPDLCAIQPEVCQDKANTASPVFRDDEAVDDDSEWPVNGYRISKDAWKEWNAYKLKYNKQYDSFHDEIQHLYAFRNNYIHIQRHNKHYEQGKAAHKLAPNQWSDVNYAAYQTGRVVNADDKKEDSEKLTKDDDATVEKNDDATVENIDDAPVEKNDDATVEKNDDVIVGQNDDATVEKNDDATVEKNDDVIVENDDDATVEKNDDATVEKNDDATVENNDDATVEKNDDATFESDDATVEKIDDVTVEKGNDVIVDTVVEPKADWAWDNWHVFREDDADGLLDARRGRHSWSHGPWPAASSSRRFEGEYVPYHLDGYWYDGRWHDGWYPGEQYNWPQYDHPDGYWYQERWHSWFGNPYDGYGPYQGRQRPSNPSWRASSNGKKIKAI